MNYLEKLLEINKQEFGEVDMYDNISLELFYDWAINENNYKQYGGIRHKGGYIYIGHKGIAFFEGLKTDCTISFESRFSHIYTESELSEWYFKDFMYFSATLDEICKHMELNKPYFDNIFNSNKTRLDVNPDKYINGRMVTNIWLMSDSKWV